MRGGFGMSKATTVNISEFKDRFDSNYSFLYDSHDAVAGYSDALDEYDRLFAASEGFRGFVGDFGRFRADPVSSDRECVAFMFALGDMVD